MADNPKKAYYYFSIPGDIGSSKLFLTQEELYEAERNLSARVAFCVQKDLMPASARRDLAKLISISYYCLGGGYPCFRVRKSSEKKFCVPFDYHDIYLSFFMQEIWRMLKKFDRSKGSWTQFVKWARGHASQYTAREMAKEERYQDFTHSIRTLLDYNEIIEEAYSEVE